MKTDQNSNMQGTLNKRISMKKRRNAKRALLALNLVAVIFTTTVFSNPVSVLSEEVSTDTVQSIENSPGTDAQIAEQADVQQNTAEAAQAVEAPAAEAPAAENSAEAAKAEEPSGVNAPAENAMSAEMNAAEDGVVSTDDGASSASAVQSADTSSASNGSFEDAGAGNTDGTKDGIIENDAEGLNEAEGTAANEESEDAASQEQLTYEDEHVKISVSYTDGRAFTADSILTRTYLDSDEKNAVLSAVNAQISKGNSADTVSDTAENTESSGSAPVASTTATTVEYSVAGFHALMLAAKNQDGSDTTTEGDVTFSAEFKKGLNDAGYASREETTENNEAGGDGSLTTTTTRCETSWKIYTVTEKNLTDITDITDAHNTHYEMDENGTLKSASFRGALPQTVAFVQIVKKTVTETTTQKETEKATEKETQKVTEKYTEKITGKAAEKTTETETEKEDVKAEVPASAAMPAVAFDQKVTTENGTVMVHIDAEEGAFEEGTSMTVTPVTRHDILDKAIDAAGGKGAAAAMDITFTKADGTKTEPLKPIHVKMISPVLNHAEEAHVVHVADSGTIDVVARKSDGKTIESTSSEAASSDAKNAVSFESDSFSVYAIVYTVDFEYIDEETGEKFNWSFPGQGSYALTDIMSVLGVEDEIESAELKLLEGEQIEGALYLSVIENVYYLCSDISFQDTYALIVKTGEKNYLIIVTDSTQTTNLNDMLNSIDIQNSNNESVIENGNEIVVDFNKEYKFLFGFKENSTWQFANTSDMFYDIPDGVDLNLTAPQDFDIRIGARVITGNKYQVVEVDGKKKIKINFNTSHFNYPFLAASQDVEIDLEFDGKITRENTEHSLDFGGEGHGYSVENREVTNSKVRKEGAYDPTTKQMKYSVYVTATEGTPKGINVKDTISGTALTFNSITSIKEYSDENGNNYVQDIALTDLTSNTSSTANGFDITIPSIPAGHTYKIEYTADVNFSAIAANNNATVSETGNTVRITADGDENPEDNESKHDEDNINFSSITKTGSLGDLIKEDGTVLDENDTTYTGKTYRVVNWKVVANTEGIVSLKDSPITDTLLNNDLVEYYGNGITVKKTVADGNTINWDTITGTEVAWSAVGVTDKTTAGGWSYTPTDDGNYAYEITYQTRVDLSTIGEGKSVDVINAIRDKYDEDTGEVTIKKEEGLHPEISKNATSVTYDNITWKIAVDIPKNWTGPLVVSDTLPNLGSFYDEIESIQVDGYTKTDNNTIGAGEYKETIENAYIISWEGGQQHWDYAGHKSFTLDFGTISSSTENRTINITVVTKNNSDWIQLGMDNPTQDTAVSHTNTVEANDGNGNTYGKDDAEGQPKPGTLTKTTDEAKEFLYYKGPDIYGNDSFYDEKGVIFPFYVKLTGVTTDKIDITETFNTDLFEIYTGDERRGYNPYADALSLYYNKVPQNLGTEVKGHVSVEPTNTGAILHVTNLPRTEGNAFWGFYTVKYYLVVKRDKINDLKSFVAENGSVTIDGDNKTGKTYTFYNNADWNGKSDSAPYTYTVNNIINKAGTLNQDGTYDYTITLNPEKLKINGTYPYELTDIFDGITIDKDSISIITDPDGTTFAVYDNATDAAEDTTHAIVITLTDGVLSATIPDQTKVIISYTGEPLGNVTIDTEKKKAIIEESNTATALDFEYHVDYTHEHDVINKSNTPNSDGSLTYTIDLNPDKIALKGGESYQLTDTFSGLTIDDESFQITVCDPDEDSTKATDILNSRSLDGNVYSFTIPDKTHVTITYNARPIYTVNQQTGDITATVSNTAEAENVPAEDGPHTIEEDILSKTTTGEMIDDASDQHNGMIPFTIVFNPTAEELNDGKDIELKDTFTNLIVEYSSVAFTPSVYPSWHAKAGENISFNYSGNTGIFQVPDKTKVTITYYAKPDFGNKDSIDWNNKVTGHGFTSETSGSSENNTTGEGFGSASHTLYLLKHQTGHMEIPIDGVTFNLSMDVNGVKTPVTYKGTNDQVQFTTQNLSGKGQGYQLMMLYSDGAYAVDSQFVDPIVGGFKADTVYYLDEVAAKEGYYKNETSYNFVWHSPTIIKTNEFGVPVDNDGHEVSSSSDYVYIQNPNDPYVKPSYLTGQRVYVFTEGETVKVTNDKISRDVEVTKNWVNADGSWDWPEGIDTVTVKLQQKVDGEDWKDISVENNNIPSQYWDTTTNNFKDGYTWSSTMDLDEYNHMGTWEDLDIEKDGKPIDYRVVEVSVTSGASTAQIENGSVTINGKTYTVLGGTVKNGSTTLLNTEKKNIDYEKRWNLPGNSFSWTVPEGVTVTDGTTTYNAGETVTINKSDLKIKVRLHRYASQGGDKVSTYDFADNEAAYNVELSGSNWKTSWTDLDTARFVDINGSTVEVDYIYEVEETEVTVPTTVLKNTDGSQIDLKAFFTAETTVDDDGNITMINRLKDDNNWYLTVEKEWRDYQGNTTTGEPVEFQLIRSGTRTTIGTDGSSDEKTTLTGKNSDSWGKAVAVTNDDLLTDIGHDKKLIVVVTTTNGTVNQNLKFLVRDGSWNIVNSYVATISGQEHIFEIPVKDLPAIGTVDFDGMDGSNDYTWAIDYSLVSNEISTDEPFDGQVMKPDPENDGKYIVDETRNHKFTITPSQTITFVNLPYNVPTSATTTETYTYTVVETSTGSNWHVVTQQGTYDPAPAAGQEGGQNGSVKLVNQYDEPLTADLTVTKKIDKANSSSSDVSFYVGLFASATDTTPIAAASVGGTNPQEVKFTKQSSDTEKSVTFEGLTIGTTYYVFETKADGTKVTTSDSVGGYSVIAGDANGKEITIAASGSSVEINNKYDAVDIDATKTWKQKDGTEVTTTLTNATVTFTLMKSTDGTKWDNVTPVTTGEDNPQTITATAALSEWKASWTALPKYDDNGNLIQYKVVESDAKINTNSTAVDVTPEGTAAEKVIVDDDDASDYKDAAAPHNNPYGEGALINELPTTTVEGKKIWNTTTVPTTDPTLTLKRKSAKPESKEETVSVASGQPVWSGSGNTRTYKYSDLPEYDNEGYKYTYTVSEASFKIGEVTYTAITKDGTNYTVTSDSATAPKFTVTQDRNDITNKELTSKTAKKVWKDVNGDNLTVKTDGTDKVRLKLKRYLNDTTTVDGTWTDIEVELDGKVDTGDNLTTGELTAWNYTWADLDKVYFDQTANDGAGAYLEYVYKVEETSVTYSGNTVNLTDGVDSSNKWIVTYDGMTVTNTLNETDFEFNKRWILNENDLEWPENQTITVTLQRSYTPTGGTEVKETVTFDVANDKTVTVNLSEVNDSQIAGTVTQTSDDNKLYSYKITGLEKFDDGDTTKKWNYTISEAKVEGYNAPKYIPKNESDPHGGISSVGTGGTIRNDQIAVTLPQTGGIGTKPIYLLGTLITLGSAILLVLRRRRGLV